MKHFFFFLFVSASLAGCGSNKPAPPKEKDVPTETQKRVRKEFQEKYASGQIKIEGTLVNEKRHGLWKSYYPDGKKWSETTFVDGVKTGPTTTYYENGMMRYNGQYENDEKVGIWNLYNTEGVLEKSVNLDEDPETEKYIQQFSSQ